MNIVTLLFIAILLLPSSFAIIGTSSSYTVDAVHTGVTGSDLEGANYSGRSTTTYQQTGTLNGSTLAYNANIGWLQAYNFAPLPGIILMPQDGAVVFGSDVILWSPWYDIEGSLITYNVTLSNSTDVIIINGSTTSLVTNVYWTGYEDGEYLLTVTGCDIDNLCSNNSINILIDNAPDFPDFRAYLHADFQEVNYTIVLWADLFNINVPYDADYVTVSIIEPLTKNYTVYQANMTKAVTGVWYYNFTPNVTGEHYAIANFYNATGVRLAAGSTSFVAQDIPQRTTEVLQMIFQMLILFVVGISFAVLAKYLGNVFFYFVSSTWFFSVAGVLFFTGSEIVTPGFFLLVALGLFFHGIWVAVDNKKARQDNAELD